MKVVMHFRKEHTRMADNVKLLSLEIGMSCG